MKSSRQKEIVELLKKNSVVNTFEMATQFGVSIETIRRDLDQMEKQGILKKTYGGAELVTEPEIDPIPLLSRRSQNHNEKVAIAAAAARFIPERATVALDAGSTLFELCEYLKQKKDMIIICSDIYSAESLLNEGNNKVYIMGGFLTMYGTSSGSFSREFFSSISGIDIFVFSSDGADPDAGLSTDEIGINDLKRRFIKRAKKRIALIDHAKFTKKSFYKMCDFEDIDLLITDSETPSSIIKKLEQQGVDVVVVDAKK